jgi:hypothetical protein
MNRITIAAAVALLAATPASAATVIRGGDTVFLAGDIDAGTEAKFRAALDDDVKVVVLNTGGGLLNVAADIGHLVREKHLATVVPQGHNCTSACMVIWTAGRPRESQGWLAIHCGRLQGESRCDGGANGLYVKLLRENGAPLTADIAAASGLPFETVPPERIEDTPLPRPKPEAVVQFAGDYVTPDEEPQWQDEPPPPVRRRPPQYYGPQPYGPPPPFWVYPPPWPWCPITSLLTAGRVCI